MLDAYKEFEQSIRHRILPLRWLYRKLVHQGFWYITIDGTKEQLCREATRNAPPSYQWFGRSLKHDIVDRELSTGCLRQEWSEVKKTLEPGDKIWPFAINPWTRSMRAGFVIVRRGKGIATILTLVS
jgi:hypothetical protein